VHRLQAGRAHEQLEQAIQDRCVRPHLPSSTVSDFVDSASLPIIFSLLGLWLILFLFFGILFLEVFGLTKWNSGENRSQNFSSMGTTLVMLTFFTTG
jgi:hypothetical protein